MLAPLLSRGALARLPLVACLRQLGGVQMLLPLLRRPQPGLRLLGLRLLTLCLGEDAAALGGPSAGAAPPLQASLGSFSSGSATAAEVVQVAGRLLAGAAAGPPLLSRFMRASVLVLQLSTLLHLALTPGRVASGA